MSAMTDSFEARFWDRAARKYAASRISNIPAYEATLDRVRRYLSPADQVLEIGAGTSTTALKLAPSVARYTASDISAEMVAIGREKMAAQGVGNLEIVQGVLGDAALGAGPFDAVLAFNLLHLTRDPGDQARMAGALLKPGGHFITKTAVRTWKLMAALPVIWLMQCVGKAPYVRLMSRRQLEQTIAGAGFEIVETATLGAHFIAARKR